MKLITQNGYFIAEPKEATNGVYKCKIVNAMPNWTRSGQRVTLSGKTGQTVLVAMDKVILTKFDKRDMLICHDSDILATVEE